MYILFLYNVFVPYPFWLKRLVSLITRQTSTAFISGIPPGLSPSPLPSTFFLQPCVRSFASTLDREVSRSAMLAGSFSASSMASSQMDKCPVTRQSVAEMTLSTLSFLRLVPASTCLAVS